MRGPVCLLLGVWLLPLASFAAAERDCAAIEDAAERLACYDARFPRKVAPAEEPVPAPGPRADDDSGSVDAPVAAESAVHPAAAKPSTTEQRAELDGPPYGHGRTFLGDRKVNLTATIKAIRAGDKQKMIFLLDNDQIWIQSTPRLLPFRVGDRVTIRNAPLGGYFMRSEGGTSTRVRYIPREDVRPREDVH